MIEVRKGDGMGSKYEALSADARRAHGLAPTFWAYDELAQAKDRELLDTYDRDGQAQSFARHGDLDAGGR